MKKLALRAFRELSTAASKNHHCSHPLTPPISVHGCGRRLSTAVRPVGEKLYAAASPIQFQLSFHNRVVQRCLDTTSEKTFVLAAVLKRFTCCFSMLTVMRGKEAVWHHSYYIQHLQGSAQHYNVPCVLQRQAHVNMTNIDGVCMQLAQLDVHAQLQLDCNINCACYLDFINFLNFLLWLENLPFCLKEGFKKSSIIRNDS